MLYIAERKKHKQTHGYIHGLSRVDLYPAWL